MRISLLCPNPDETKYRQLTNDTIHDLGLDMLCSALTAKPDESKRILRIMSQLSSEPAVCSYRAEIFDDLYNNKSLRENLMNVLDKISFLKEYGSYRHSFEESNASVWELMHRLGELKDYIGYVEALSACFEGTDVKSEGLIKLKDEVQRMYSDRGFAELKKDIESLRANTDNIKSVTVGINLNERFETESIGVVSINNKSFGKAGIIGAFSDFIQTRDNIKDGNEWDGDYKFQPFSGNGVDIEKTMERVGKFSAAVANPLMATTLAKVPEGDPAGDISRYMDKVTNRMLFLSVRRLKEVLNSYAMLSITSLTDLIPELLYYVRWVEYIEKLKAKGYLFCKPEAVNTSKHMAAVDLYNLKLAFFESKEHETIVTNNLTFDENHLVYILTGANRGGKTTITQAVGIMFVLAQGGIYVPAGEFRYTPVDNIFTHFPADEEKTMDLGRLGEECRRFRDIFRESTENSLLLLNETFSTTSFEEGYLIAVDAVKAILHKGVRTIYNTHMHKLGCDVPELNKGDVKGKACSLIMRTEAGERSYKVDIAPPEGMSYARDIAEKYGVTLEKLME